MVPWPHSIAGWILSSTFYIFLLYSSLLLSFYYPMRIYLFTHFGLEDDFSITMLSIVTFMLIVAFTSRYLAIRSAKAAIRHAREKFEREKASLAHTELVQNF